MYYLYLIKNTINKRCYVGVSNNPKNRFRDHKNGIKSNPVLQNSFRKHGYDNFAFEVICYGSKEEILLLEASVVNIKEDYNITDGGGMPPSFQGKKLSEESRKKISEARRGIPLGPHTEEFKGLMSQYHKEGRLTKPKTHICKKVKCIEDDIVFDNMDQAAKYYNIDRSGVSRAARGIIKSQRTKGKTFVFLEEYTRDKSYNNIDLPAGSVDQSQWQHKGKNHYMWGKPVTEETRKRLSILRKGVKASEETRKKISEGLKGRVYSVETKLKIQRSQKCKAVRCLEDNKEFISVNEAARFYGVSQGHLTSVLKGRRKTTGGLRFVYITQEPQLFHLLA